MIFTFCPKCRNELQHNSKFLFVCLKCGSHFYDNPVATNAVILENAKKEILLTKRKYDPAKNMWDLPGGFLQPQENIEQSITRELEEELGIKISVFEYFHSYIDEYLYKGVKSHVLSLVFLGKLDSDILITPNDDVADYTFFSIDKLPFKYIAFDCIRKALKDYLMSKS
jgi:mutator protein MutT